MPKIAIVTDSSAFLPEALVHELTDGKPMQAAIIHANVPHEGELLMEKAADRFQCTELYITGLSPVLATHTGPGTLGMAICPEVTS